MVKKTKDTGTISNRRASFDYELGDSLVVGISLTGAETKSLRLGHGQLRGAYVNVINDELWLLNAQINGSAGVKVLDETRSRKLLAKKSEIEKLKNAKQAGSTIIPLEIIISGRYIKLRIAPGKGKKQYDKRHVLKKRMQEREVLRHSNENI